MVMKSMGISASMDAFFSSNTAFTNVKTGTLETDKEAYFRQEIWLWLNRRFQKGSLSG